jgi:predicted nucleotide-binding protein (sugar kinase/HSP70/actin superfamily)
MKTKIGIQRVFYYYDYFPLFKTFFEELGCEIVLAKETSMESLKEGAKYSTDEFCLPIKHFLGQVKELKEKCDYILIPNISSEKGKAINCSRIVAAGDLARMMLETKTIEPSFHPDKLKQLKCLRVNSNPVTQMTAIRKAIKAQKKYQKLLDKNYDPEQAFNIVFNNQDHFDKILNKKTKHKFRIALIGHSYSIHDKHLNFNIKEKLRELDAEPITRTYKQSNYKGIDKPHFILGKIILDTIIKQQKKVDGMIYLSPFGCSPDSLLNVFIKKINRTPMLNLVIDQHTAENALDTRLEAFIDLISRKK